MKTISQAFAPANISCAFKIYSDPNPRFAGSYGLGFTLNEGVTVEVSHGEKTEIILNESVIDLPTVLSVVSVLTPEPLKIILESSLPLGTGYGISGASALATAYAINDLMDLKKSDLDLAIIAHTAEVENGTGLGDVVNQYTGGMCLKLKPSSEFVVIPIPITATAVYCQSFSGITTKSIINSPRWKKKIDEAADIVLADVAKLVESGNPIEFSEIIHHAKRFALYSGLLTDDKTRETMTEIEQQGGHASMIMLGNAVFSDISFPGSRHLEISTKKATLL